MATNTIHEIRPVEKHWQAAQDDEHVGCSIGIMAYNEEANIGRTIHAVLQQQGPSLRVEEVIIVASADCNRYCAPRASSAIVCAREA